MEFQIDASGPIYRQLVEQILARIKTGESAAGGPAAHRAGTGSPAGGGPGQL